MAQLVICDICGKTPREEDLRYVEIYKYKGDDRKPVIQKLEICAVCTSRVTQAINQIREDAKSSHSA